MLELSHFLSCSLPLWHCLYQLSAVGTGIQTVVSTVTQPPVPRASVQSPEGEREGGRERRREGGRKGEKEGRRDGGREGGKEGEKEERKEGERKEKRGRKGEREGEMFTFWYIQ